jgi:predicted Zn-dependent protease
MDGAIMIRIIVALLLIIAVFTGLVLFPAVTNQPVRIEVLGWLFETRTGMFILALLFVFGVVWALQKLFNFSVNSPKQLWLNLRSGNKKRRELRFQEALDTWIDEGEGQSKKLLKRSKGVAPDWLHEALLLWWDTPSSHPKINIDKDDPRIIALKARLATDADHSNALSMEEKQQYIDAWLSAHPAAPLALMRKATWLGEQEKYAEQVALLEDLWQKKRNATAIKPLLASALRMLAKADVENGLAHLRKANRINPSDSQIIIDLADALHDSGDKQSGVRLLLEYVEHHDDMMVAKHALALLEEDAVSSFKLVDKPSFQSQAAGSWLRLMLAHKANLRGLAGDALTALLERSPSALLWKTRGDWYAEQQQWQKATHAYQQACNFNP